jgi:PTS system mannitol-specific IIC component
MCPKGGFLPVIAGIVVGFAVSFLIASVIVKRSHVGEDDISFDEAKNLVGEMKAESKGKKVLSSISIPSLIVFACDAGMGSSAMGASILRNKVKKAGLGMEVINTAINNLPSDADVVVTHKDLTDRAKAKLPNVIHISVENFLNSPKYDELVENLKTK